MANRKLAIMTAVSGMLFLSACSGVNSTGSIGAIDSEQPDKHGYYEVHTTQTPYSGLLYCVDEKIDIKPDAMKTIAVSYIGDESGKTGGSELEKAVSQGAVSMMESALDRTGAFRVIPSYDRTVIEREKKAAFEYNNLYRYIKGVLTRVDREEVKVVGSDYYITGAITSVNEHLSSSKVGVTVNNKGVKARTYTARIEMDIKVIDSVKEQVVKSWPVAKTVTGYEMEAGLFSFVGDDLFDLELGYKTVEPRDMAVRSIIEAVTYDITSTVYGFDKIFEAKGIENPCVDYRNLRELREESLTDPMSKG